MKIMFLDESGDHSLDKVDDTYPVFVLAGCIFADLNALLSRLEFVIIAAAINKKHLKKQYVEPDNPYHLCFRFILERSVMYLGRWKEQIMFRIESRETHNDRKLAQEYELFRGGNDKFGKEEVLAKLADLSFNQKSQNIAGMQIADLVAYPIGKWAMDMKRENAAFDLLKSKIHSKDGKYLGYGLKVFP